MFRFILIQLVFQSIDLLKSILLLNFTVVKRIRTQRVQSHFILWRVISSFWTSAVRESRIVDYVALVANRSIETFLTPYVSKTTMNLIYPKIPKTIRLSIHHSIQPKTFGRTSSTTRPRFRRKKRKMRKHTHSPRIIIIIIIAALIIIAKRPDKFRPFFRERFNISFFFSTLRYIFGLLHGSVSLPRCRWDSPRRATNT